MTMWKAVGVAEYDIAVRVSHFSLTVRSCVCWMNELAKIDQRFSIYFSAVTLLHVARKISRSSCTNDLRDVLSIILGSNVNAYGSLLSQLSTELRTSEQVELLQKSAGAQLTTYRQLIAPDFGSVVTIVTTDIEALYAYKRGDYQRCLQLPTQNVHTLLYFRRLHGVPIIPQFIQLLDDDSVSLSALTVIIDSDYRVAR